MPRAHKWSAQEDQVLTTRYLDIPDMGIVRSALPGRSLSAIYWRASVLRRQGLIDKCRSARRYSQNDDFFRSDGLLTFYWAGFIAADGCIHTNPVGECHTLSVCLSKLDKHHLHTFAAHTEFTGPVAEYGNNIAQIQVYGAQAWCADLVERFNITARKSLTLQPPNLTDDDQILSFIAGLIDGDGWITKRPQAPRAVGVGLCGTKAIMIWVKEHIDRLIPAARMGDINFYKSGLAHVGFGGRRAYQLLALLPDGLPLLARKWDKLTGGD